ncbi:uncharacterized protein LOC130665943 [Microplitis mediator]|uniref:uncharacterized protein LOC130665943 n=1 Tax=Microplitis mediator TaxID=375433 RepID=UPI0025535762|nr:uncharacterized protein LOC130665943 [Microplitis mediator]
MYAVNYLSQFNTNYNVEHWKAAKRVLRYLKGTLDYGLRFEQTGLALFAVVDANWGGDSTDRKSFTGYGFILVGSVISWEARKQKSVALSSTEAEYMAVAEATKEDLYLKGLLVSLGIQEESETVTIPNDNQSAISMIKNDVYHQRTKHIDVRHHFVRNEYAYGVIDVKYLCTERMPADMFTKGLSAIKHRKCVSNIGIVN